jgi:putative membrane protein
MKAVTLCATLFLLAGQDLRGDEKPFDDASFVVTAATSAIHEVELARIAQSQAKNEAVRKFAETLATDHSKANEELKKIATEAGLKVPDKMNPEHQKVVDTFKEYKGDNFDRDYVKHMIAGHEKSADLFKRASKDAKDAKLKDFAARTLPVIQAHLDAARKLEVK